MDLTSVFLSWRPTRVGKDSINQPHGLCAQSSSSLLLLSLHLVGSSSNSETAYDMPALVVFGGNGYVGTRVCAEAINSGLRVVSISRRGRPAHIRETWADEVEWIQVR